MVVEKDTPYRKKRNQYGLPSLLVAVVVILLLWWHWWSPHIVVLLVHQDSSANAAIPIKSTPPPPPQAAAAQAAVQRAKLRPSDLVDLLTSLAFKNYGVVKSSDAYVWSDITCTYLEAQNVSDAYTSWADSYGQTSYLFQSVGGVLVHPPTGMRSSVPLGGISTGSFELRADGTFHEWTIFNQHPAGPPKFQTLDNTFMGLYVKRASGHTASYVLQTNPSDGRLPGVQSLMYQGAHPMSKLVVMDSRLPVTATVYAYSRYKVGDMNTSATPAVAFTAILENPLNETLTASFMFNFPHGIEPHTQRLRSQMSPNESQLYQDCSGKPLESIVATDPTACFEFCNDISACSSWTYDKAGNLCIIFGDVRMNGYQDGYSSGVKGIWRGDGRCATVNRVGTDTAAGGNMSLCGFSSDATAKLTYGASNDVYSTWSQFASTGSFEAFTEGYFVNGAAAGMVTLGPYQTKEVTIVLGWYFPDRDFIGLRVGNFYEHLFKSSAEAAEKLGSSRVEAVTDIAKLHEPFFTSSMPTYLQDILINSLSHIRSAFWVRDGRWRQWEAYDCVNIDSVHNDGERHIPYITIFPNSTINKLQAWAKYQVKPGQQNAGMITEELRQGYLNLPYPPRNMDIGEGRVMSDVSSMFIAYLLELYTWTNDSYTRGVVSDLWPSARGAAQWHLDITQNNGYLPSYLVSTYDILGLDAYKYATYNGAFHLLAMKAAEKLAYLMGDDTFAATCHDAFVKGQVALDQYLWNEGAQCYNAYIAYGGFDYERYRNSSNLTLCEYEAGGGDRMDCITGDPTTPGAVMADTFYAQVLAYSLGLGTLVQNETRLRLHMKAELEYNDSPWGLMALTGSTNNVYTNSIWALANPNWATTNIHLQEDINLALQVAGKSLDYWRSVLNDQWNIAGILGGTLANSGLPYITSHYGFYMTAWHIVLALSGQVANMTQGSLTFEPKLSPPFTLPVMLPGVWGYVDGEVFSPKHPIGGYVQYTVGLNFGSITLESLSISGCGLPINGSLSLRADELVRWDCDL